MSHAIIIPELVGTGLTAWGMNWLGGETVAIGVKPKSRLCDAKPWFKTLGRSTLC